MKRVMQSHRLYTARDLAHFLREVDGTFSGLEDEYVEVAGKRVVGAEVIEQTLSDKSLVYDIRLLTER